MATYTTNYNLEKPAQTDIYNVDVFNDNADKIDAGLTDKAEKTMLAPVETTNIASRNYAKGEYFVYNGFLCCATTAIASSGTIAIGTNCATAPVGGELTAIKDALTPSTYPVSTSLANDCTIVKSGNVKSLIFTTGLSHSYTNGQFTTVGTISDANFRPTTTAKVIGIGAADKLYQLVVTSQGVIQVWNYGATGAISAAMTLTYI